jgi:hypothetical protein
MTLRSLEFSIYEVDKNIISVELDRDDWLKRRDLIECSCKTTKQTKNKGTRKLAYNWESCMGSQNN